jgi:hypothetical protein
MAAVPVPAPEAEQSWRFDLASPEAKQANIAHGTQGITINDPKLRTPSVRGSFGVYTAPAKDLGRPLTAFTVERRATLPAGSRLLVELRGRNAGEPWTEWREAAGPGEVILPHAVTELQVRLTLEGAEQASAAEAPTVSDVVVRAADKQPTSSGGPGGAMAEQRTYRIFATREGLVGGVTANGHVIQERDHFVALPSRRMLAGDGGDEYRVRVCYQGRCETAPVWDVGPWNTADDYWNTASRRENWNDLPQGTPEAEAAYLDGYNDGRDEFGRRVQNAAGLDLADGVFWDGLGMTDNDWVDLTFLPTVDDVDSGGGK